MRRLVSLAAVAALIALPAFAQTSNYKPPRTPDGKPDLQGFWTNESITRLERDPKLGNKLAYTPQEAAEIEKTTDERNQRLLAPTDQTLIATWEGRSGPDTADECQSGSRGTACGYNAGWTSPGDRLARVNGQPRTSFITFPENGRIPPRITGANTFNPGDEDEGEAGDSGPGAARGGNRTVAAAPAGRGRGGAGAGAAMRQNDNPEGRSLGERCIMSFGRSSGPVMTSQLYNNNYQFVQTKDHFAIWVEMVHDVRIAPIHPSRAAAQAAHRKDGVRPYMGDSVAWWEGDTLTVETTNFHPRQNFYGASDQLKVTERFSRVGEDRVLYRFTVEDPKTWAEPWGGEYEFQKALGVYEYACHEGNYGLENILAGARQEDAEAAARAAQNTASR